MTDAEQRLDQAIEGLPRSVRPGRDLWPEIEARIMPPVRGSGYWALAAGWLLTAVGIGLLGWRLSMAPVEVSPWPDGALAAEFNLDATRLELRNELDRAVALLSPADRAALVAELDGLRAASEAVLAALREAPADALLQELAASNARRELAVMRQVTQLSHEISQRT